MRHPDASIEKRKDPNREGFIFTKKRFNIAANEDAARNMTTYVKEQTKVV